MGRIRYAAAVSFFSIALAVAFFASIAVGAVQLSLTDVVRAFSTLFSGGEKDATAIIIIDLRLARSLLAMCVGAALAVSGAAFQGFFRNPLADPYVIGASSGAAFGAALAIALGVGDLGPVSGAAAAAFVGALGAVMLAFSISRLGGNRGAAALLLSGTALSALFSAALSLVIALRDKELHRVYYWLLGGFAGTGWKDLFSALPIMAAGCFLVAVSARPLDLLAFGEDSASGMGLDVKRARLFIAAGASLAAAAAVAAAGIIGFVGLVAPHIVRLLVGPNHRRLLPVSALAGAVLVSAADTVSRTVAAPLELPIGVVTSLIGAPFFLYLIARKSKFLGG